MVGRSIISRTWYPAASEFLLVVNTILYQTCKSLWGNPPEA